MSCIIGLFIVKV